MTKKIIHSMAATVAIFALSSCATQGTDFSSNLDWIKIKTTTKKDVQSLLKEPHSVGSSGGQPTWTYGYYQYRLFGKSSTKELKFFWNPDGTLQTFSFNSSFPDDIKKK